MRRLIAKSEEDTVANSLRRRRPHYNTYKDEGLHHLRASKQAGR